MLCQNTNLAIKKHVNKFGKGWKSSGALNFGNDEKIHRN